MKLGARQESAGAACSGPMMGDSPYGVVARRTRPSSVASFGRVTHAPRGLHFVQGILRGQFYISLGRRLGSIGVGSIRHRPQNFLRRWVGGWVGGGAELFKEGWGGGCGWCDKLQQSVVYVNVEVPQIQFIDRVVDFSVVLQRRVPTVQTVQKTDEIPQLQSLDKGDDTRCCTMTGAWVDRAEICGGLAVALL